MIWIYLLSFAVIFGCVQSQITCPDVFCPSQPATCTCHVTGNTLTWAVIDTNGATIGSVTHVRAGDGINFNTSEVYQLSNSIPFTSTLTNIANPVINATISFTVEVNYNGYRIECVGSNTVADNVTVPESPTVVPNSLPFTPNSFTSVTLSWMMTPSDQQCLTGYQLVINPGAETIPISSISTTSHTLNDRMRGIQYCYNISVVDTGNRAGPSSDSQCFTLDTPLQPVIGELSYQFPENSSYPNGTANVTLAWMQPASSRSPVTSYQVIHNISNTGDNVTTTVPSPTITITGATLGSTYSILIIPSNTLGEGPAAFTTIVIPTESPTDPSSPVGGLGPGPIAGIIVGVIIVIAGIIMLTVVLLLVCVMFNKRNKNNKPSNEKGQVTEMNYANMVHSTNPTSSQGRKPVTSSRNQTKPAQEESVTYSDVQSQSPQREAAPGGLVYADVSHSVPSRGNPKADSIGRVEYTSLQGTARN